MSLNVQLLETSFALVRDRQDEFTQCFYSNLFADYPEVKPLFKSTNMEEQAKKLFASLVLVVNNLKKPDKLTESLKGMGNKHVDYGVLPKHYPMVGMNIVKVMSIVLKEEWTPEMEKAWTEAYSAIAAIMLEGAEESA